MKKLIIFIFLLCSFSFFIPSSKLTTAKGYEKLYFDLSATDDYSMAIRYLSKKGVIQGYANGYFKPKNPIKRSELMKMLMDHYHSNYTYSDGLRCFPDIPEFEWYTKSICKAKRMGFVHGFAHDGLFHPELFTTRAEAAKIILNTMGVKTPVNNPNVQTKWLDVNSNDWFAGYANIIKTRNLLPEDWTYFYPYRPIERDLAAELIFRITVMQETGMDTYNPEAIATWEFGGHEGVYTVKYVTMDDTIIIDKNGKDTKVRLLGIDKPDFYAEDCYVDEAYRYAKEVLVGKKIEMKADPFGEDKNDHGELMRYVYFEGMHDFSFNYQLLYDGFAYIDEEELWQFNKQLNEALGVAYALGRGLWDPEACRFTTTSLYEMKINPTEYVESDLDSLD